MKLTDLTTNQLAQLKIAFNNAMLSLIKDYQDKLNVINNQINELNSKERALWEVQKTQVYPASSQTMNERMEIKKQIIPLQAQVMKFENIIFCLENGGMLSSIIDKKDTEHNEIPDFRKIDTNQIYFDNETILTDKSPLYVPKIDEEEFRLKGYVFDAIRLEKDTYILATTSHREKEPTDYVLVTLDQLVLISDYYYTKAKATNLKEAKESTDRQEKYWDNLPELKRENFLMQQGIYRSLPAKIQKEISKEDYEALDWKGREKIYKFFKRYGPKKITSKLDDNHMWRSFHEMYERFIDPTATHPKPGYANNIVFSYWREFREMMNYKIKDIQIQRDDLSEMRKAAIETSFGESNTSDALKNEYGILVKRQNGDKINPIEVEQIKNSFVSVQQKLGNLKEICLKKNIKISHTGVRNVFASKAIGMYVPSMGTIAVSDKYGAVMFKLIMAHEFTHFIDNYIGELNGKRYATDDYENTAGKIAFLFRDNMNKPKQQQTDYTNATKECFARAFEQYYGIETFGEEVGISFSDKPLARETPFFVADDFVNKETYTTKLKPLIEQFLTENNDIFKYSVDVDNSNTPVAVGTERNESLVAEAIEVLQILFQLSDEKDKEDIESEINSIKNKP